MILYCAPKHVLGVGWGLRSKPYFGRLQGFICRKVWAPGRDVKQAIAMPGASSLAGRSPGPWGNSGGYNESTQGNKWYRVSNTAPAEATRRFFHVRARQFCVTSVCLRVGKNRRVSVAPPLTKNWSTPGGAEIYQPIRLDSYRFIFFPAAQAG